MCSASVWKHEIGVLPLALLRKLKDMSTTTIISLSLHFLKHCINISHRLRDQTLMYQRNTYRLLHAREGYNVISQSINKSQKILEVEVPYLQYSLTAIKRCAIEETVCKEHKLSNSICSIFLFVIGKILPFSSVQLSSNLFDSSTDLKKLSDALRSLQTDFKSTKQLSLTLK